MLQAASLQDTNKALVQASFDRWARGTGSPFELIRSFNVRTRTPFGPSRPSCCARVWKCLLSPITKCSTDLSCDRLISNVRPTRATSISGPAH
jgi:hypothetical protein